VVAVVGDPNVQQDPVNKVLASRVVLDRRPFARVFDEDIRTPSGQVMEHFIRVELANFVIVCAVTRDKRVAVIRQFRQALQKHIDELPAGIIDDGESPEDAVKRELEEETGVRASSWQHLGTFIMDPNRGCGWMYAYLATDAEVATTAEGDGTEHIEARFMPLDEARERLNRGEFVSAPTALCLSLALARL
jgi:ADP-ribose pyrophosphatase